VAQKK